MANQSRAATPLQHLSPVSPGSDELHIVIETPKGHRNKYAYDDDLGLFVLSGVLPAGAVFPYDFGFVPATLGADGDPLDVLVLMDEPAFAGCVVRSRLVGVIEAEQTERDGATMRNDRLIAVATKCRLYGEVRSLADFGERLVNEIEHFFVSYNAITGKEFKPLGRFGPDRARQRLDEAIAYARRQGKQTPKTGNNRAKR